MKSTLIPVAVFLIFVSCTKNPIDQIQGIYSVNKDSLRSTLTNKVGTDNNFANRLMDKMIENVVIEFKVSGDSVKGLIFMAGKTTILDSKIELRNDSMLIKSGDSEICLIPHEGGLRYKAVRAEANIFMVKSAATEISPTTKEVLMSYAEKAKEHKEFEENLGAWQTGNFVDEFGDKTKESFVYTVVRGSHENSVVMGGEVFVKAIVQEGAIYFQIFNRSMSMRETMPESEFGTIKIKFPNGEVKNEQAFFYKNAIHESAEDKVRLIYGHLMTDPGELKVLIDLSTVSRYHTDKYQFSLGKGNLAEVLPAQAH